MQKNKDIDKFYHSYQAFLTASKNHNVDTCTTSITYLEEQESVFWDNVLAFIEDAKSEIEAIKQQYTDNLVYTTQLYNALIAKNLPVDMNDNFITLGPLTIEVKVEEFQIIMSLGRKKKKINDLEISKVTKYVDQYYKAINSSFNVNTFISRLLKAYEYINKSVYASQTVQFGNAVPLDDIFKIFTISPSSSDYKKENFLWDLGRLISLQVNHPNYQIEFGFSRHHGHTMSIKDADGNVNNFSSITIYKKEDSKK